MKTDLDAELEDRLVRYAAIDSQSDETSPSSPSTDIQYDILRLLADELSSIGASDVELTDYGVVLATIPATVKTSAPVMGLLAHVDTAPAYRATGVKPVVHRGYNGGPISFADAPGLTLSPDHSPYLATKRGHDIITASGTTLLGADDKAGVAIIMTAARHLLTNPDIPHGKIRIAFTPDEEIGRGVHERLPKDLGADFAFTFDGAEVGKIEYESFYRWRHRAHHRCVDPPGNRQGQTRQRAAPGRKDCRHASTGDLDARDDGGAGRLHSCLRHAGHGRRGRAEVHSA